MVYTNRKFGATDCVRFIVTVLVLAAQPQPSQAEDFAPPRLPALPRLPDLPDLRNLPRLPGPVSAPSQPARVALVDDESRRYGHARRIKQAQHDNGRHVGQYRYEDDERNGQHRRLLTDHDHEHHRDQHQDWHD